MEPTHLLKGAGSEIILCSLNKLLCKYTKWPYKSFRFYVATIFTKSLLICPLLMLFL